MPRPDLLIVGGSVRTAAWCAVRAGLKVAALDRYNDLDLRAVADPVIRWDGSDGQVERVVGELGVPWRYTGPLENRPDLIARCERLAPLLGTPAAALRAVRDPFRLHAALTEWAASEANGDDALHVLPVRRSSDPPPLAPPGWDRNPRFFMCEGDDGPWVVKPLDSCGGYGIAVWDAAVAADPYFTDRPHYFQRIRSNGRPCYPGSAAAEMTAGGVRWFGACSTGPAQMLGMTPPNFRNELLRGPGFTGSWLAGLLGFLGERFGLRGPFGVDLMAYSGGPGRWAVLEVNPRLSASMDLYPTAHGPFGTASAGPTAADGPRRCRRTVFSTADVAVGELPVFGPTDNGWVADVPAPGTVIPERFPVCTVYADDDDSGDPGRRGLAAAEARVRAVLTPHPLAPDAPERRHFPA